MVFAESDTFFSDFLGVFDAAETNMSMDRWDSLQLHAGIGRGDIDKFSIVQCGSSTCGSSLLSSS